MKHKYTFVILLLLFSHTFYCQVCRPGVVLTPVKSGATNYHLATGGELFKLNTLPNFVTPDYFPNLMFASSLWIAGKTKSGEIKFAGTTYRNITDNYDFYPGPIDNDGNTNTDNCKNWDRHFKILKSDLKKSIELLYDDNGNIQNDKCDQLPENVKYWPANGNPFWSERFDFPLPNQALASFYDHDKDGSYDPCKGDLPMLESNNCNLQSPQEVKNAFPDQMYFWIINDVAGPHKLSGGKPLKMEIQNYYFSFFAEDKSIEDMSFFKFKALYKGEEEMDNVMMGIWLDPDIGCYSDDYLGIAKKEDLVFAYNVDNQDGTINGDCYSGLPTLGQNLPMFGASFLQGMHDFNNKNTGLISTFITALCIGSPAEPCDPKYLDVSFHNAMFPDSIKYNFLYNGNPANPLDTSMCSANAPLSDRRIVMTTGNVSMKKGETNEAIVALSIAKNVPHPCPDWKYIIDMNQKAKDIYNNCWAIPQGVDAIDPPNVNSVAENNTIILKLDNNNFGNNNKNEKYSQLISGLENVEKNKFKFEGYKLYQVASKDYGLYNLGDNKSHLISTFDLKNTVTNVYNWELGYDTNGNKIFAKHEKALGNNTGIPQEILIDYDYLNNDLLQNGKEYYYVLKSYAYNNYEEYDSQNNTGQKNQYLESVENKIIGITPKLIDKYFDAQITRINGQGTSNDLKITKLSEEKILGENFNGIITYEKNHGPFDIQVLDSNLVINKKFQLNINGKINAKYRECKYYEDSTFMELKDLESGESIVATNPISFSNDYVFEKFGIKVNLINSETPGNNNNTSHSYIDEKLFYQSNTSPKWFNAIRDIDDQLENKDKYQFDPIFNNGNPYRHSIPNNSGTFFPFYFARNTDVKNSIYLSPVNNDIFPSLIDEKSGPLFPKSLNNVDIIFTKDKSKWSRCIVVESGIKSLATSTDIEKNILSRKENKSVDKDGMPENNSVGFSWFPGYAIDVENGKRLNIFFAENTSMSNINSKFKDASIVDDMMFNPSDESFIYNKDSLIEENLLFGGHHYIYVTRQEYDSCKQLSILLKNSNTFKSKRAGQGFITWVSMPYLTEGSNLLSYKEGVIPNDLKISLRVQKPYFPTQDFKNIPPLQDCTFDNKLQPQYQFSFEKAKNIITDIILPRWSFSHSFEGFKIFDLEENIEVIISDINGKIIETKKLGSGEIFDWKGASYSLNKSMVLVKVKSITNGIVKAYKTVMFY